MEYRSGVCVWLQIIRRSKYGDCVVQTRWLRGANAVTVWYKRGDCVVTVWSKRWSKRGDCVVTVWSKRGPNAVTLWYKRGDFVVQTWSKHGDCVVQTRWLCGPNAVNVASKRCDCGVQMLWQLVVQKRWTVFQRKQRPRVRLKVGPGRWTSSILPSQLRSRRRGSPLRAVSSVQFKMVSMSSEKPIFAPSRLSEVSPVLLRTVSMHRRVLLSVKISCMSSFW